MSDPRCKMCKHKASEHGDTTNLKSGHHFGYEPEHNSCPCTFTPTMVWEDALSSATAVIDALDGFQVKYADHTANCDLRWKTVDGIFPFKACTCGYSAALDAIKKLRGE